MKNDFNNCVKCGQFGLRAQGTRNWKYYIEIYIDRLDV